MTDKGKFGANKPPSARAGQLDCAAVELWLAEAAEASLSPAVQQQLRDHAAGCPGCREKLDRVRQGREWLLVLKQEALEPPVDLVAKILAQTSLQAGLQAEAGPDIAVPATREFPVLGHPAAPYKPKDWHLRHDADAAKGGKSLGKGVRKGAIPADGSAPAGSSVPVWQHNSVVVLRRTFFDPRLALVAAMAFFSITLTLNLMGVRLTNMHVADLHPLSLGRAVTRQYAEANASVVRYYENLRIVYEVESRVRQIRRAAQTAPQPERSNVKPRKQSSNATRDSSHDRTDSHKEGKAVPDPRPIEAGPRMDASFHSPAAAVPVIPNRQAEQFVQWTLRIPPAISTARRATFPPVLRDFPCASRMICISMHRFSTRERRLA